MWLTAMMVSSLSTFVISLRQESTLALGNCFLSYAGFELQRIGATHSSETNDNQPEEVSAFKIM